MHRDFKGVWIPREIWLDRNLSWTEKLLLVEIHSLQGHEGCFASNEHFAEFLGSSVKTVKNNLSLLKAAGLIEVEGYGQGRRIFVVDGVFLPVEKVSRNRDEVSRNRDGLSRKSDRVSRNRDSSIYRNINTEINTKSNYITLVDCKSTPTKKGSRLGDDFEVTTEMVAWASERNLTVDLATETEKFKNYWAAAPGAKGVKLDWVATWRNWMLNAEGYSHGKAGQTDRKQSNTERLAGYEAMFAKYATDPDA